MATTYCRWTCIFVYIWRQHIAGGYLCPFISGQNTLLADIHTCLCLNTIHCRRTFKSVYRWPQHIAGGHLHSFISTDKKIQADIYTRLCLTIIHCMRTFTLVYLSGNRTESWPESPSFRKNSEKTISMIFLIVVVNCCFTNSFRCIGPKPLLLYHVVYDLLYIGCTYVT